MNKSIKIRWYRCKVDKRVMSDLMKTSDLRGFCQVIPQIALFAATGTAAYLAFLNIHASNWPWSVPLLLAALFVHGTFGSFMGLAGPVHELCHKTPFRSKAWNEFFLKVYSFISWSDFVSFRPSHVKHHQMTVHNDYDGEVVLPSALDWYAVKFWVSVLTVDPIRVFGLVKVRVLDAIGGDANWNKKSDWMREIMPESNQGLRREHRDWARTVVLGQLALAILFAATGHWFLIIVFNFGTMYAGWLGMLCGTPQHIGMTPNVPDFRLCCRSFTCHWLPGFLYWNMQYHVEHHMFPAVPFFNLPKLRKAIEHDLPPVTHGLWATWKEILPVVRRQKVDPTYTFVPRLPQGSGDQADDETLEKEAAALA
ncbi:MAG: fatty acid desaturase [Terrimicrobiaceae bacterium]|nr:fatty acid desaturase [Terrimicrobiaceae bacterium]